jgi:hypothetical protein
MSISYRKKGGMSPCYGVKTVYNCIMKQIKILVLTFLLPALTVQGQTYFNHALGLSVYGWDGIPGLMYSPRLTLLSLNDQTNISIGTHIGINYGLYTGELYVLDLPLVMEMNFGHGAHRYNEKKNGGFMGLGYGFMKLDDDNIQEQGLLMNVGFRRRVFDASLGLRLSLLTDITFSFGYFSLGAFYTFP